MYSLGFVVGPLLNGGGVGGLQDFSVIPSPHRTNLGFELGFTGLGLGLRGLRTKGLGPGLDNK